MLQSARQFRTIALVATLAGAATIAACNDDDDDLTNPTEEEFTVAMNGANERPTPVTTPANAAGTAELSFTGSGAISYTITVQNLSGPATAAHIHGPADASEVADPIVTFSNLSASPNGLLGSGTITTTGVAAVSLDSLKRLLRNGKAYINVHTAANQPGEIRGQIIAQ